MHIESAHIQEFIGIYKNDFREELTEDEARFIITEMLEFYQILLAPLPSESESSTQ